MGKGFVTKIITDVIMFFMRCKIKELDNMIDPEKRKAVIASHKALEEEVEKYNKLLEKPEIRKEIESSGKSMEDFKIDKYKM